MPVVPFLIIVGSGAVDAAFQLKRAGKTIAVTSLIFVWCSSLIYTLACDNIYAYGDIRYEETDWIKKNIKHNERMLIIGHPELVIHNELSKYYDIIVLNDSREKFNAKYNRHYIKGKQLPLTREEARDIADSLKQGHGYFVIYPVFEVRDRIDILKTHNIVDDYGLDLSSQRTVKEFFRPSESFFWRPNLGGYEPKKIVIAHE